MQPVSPRSKAVDSTAAHGFLTGRCNGCVFPVSDKQDRFYYYYDICPILPERKERIDISNICKDYEDTLLEKKAAPRLK